MRHVFITLRVTVMGGVSLTVHGDMVYMFLGRSVHNVKLINKINVNTVALMLYIALGGLTYMLSSVNCHYVVDAMDC